uniref:Putative molybdopterin-guanine dinucleotide biosynthesis protein A n=1 Tax=Lygus hesperus TaxID=30085 RepID=A0A0A9VXT0_LYGHE
MIHLLDSAESVAPMIYITIEYDGSTDERTDMMKHICKRLRFEHQVLMFVPKLAPIETNIPSHIRMTVTLMHSKEDLRRAVLALEQVVHETLLDRKSIFTIEEQVA